MKEVVVFWFRRDLRWVDNTGLYYALSEGLPVLPVFIFDTTILEKLEHRSDARVTFIHNQIARMDEHFRKLGSGVCVFHCDPLSAFRQLAEEYVIKSVFTNRDYEPYAIRRDLEVEAYLKEKGTSFYSFKDHVIFEKGEILNDLKEPYKVFTPYKNKWLDKFSKTRVSSLPSEELLGSLLKDSGPAVLPLSSLGFESTTIDLPEPILDVQLVRSYQETRNFPSKRGTSRLGIHLRFGTLSIRKLVIEGQKHSDTWLSELIWREFYIMILAHFPHVVDRAFKSAYDRVEWVNDPEVFERWCEGSTGYPIVDAGMRELTTTGFMHNRVRMIVASFLTKHLLIDWRWGEQFFASKLLDFELASNNGGWQWAAGTGTDAQPYFRVFNPYAQQEKFDPDFAYIRKWVPEFQEAGYPKPIVNHSEARLRAIKTYKEALS